MSYTIHPRKYAGRTTLMVSAIYTVIIIALCIVYTWYWSLALLLLPSVLLPLFIMDLTNRKAMIEVTDDEIVCTKCAVKEIGFAIKRHDTFSIKRSDIKSTELEVLDRGRASITLLCITLKNEEVVCIMSGLFKSKDIDELQMILDDGNVPTVTASKIEKRQWIIAGVIVVAAIVFIAYMNRTEKTGEPDYDIALVENMTEHSIKLKMVHNDSIETPWEVTIPPMSTITMRDDLSLSSSLPKISERMLAWWPKSFVKDTVYVVFDDSISIPNYYFRDTTGIHYFPEKCFLDDSQWAKQSVHVATKHHYGGSRFNRRVSSRDVYRTHLTYYFKVKDYKAAVEYTNKQKNKK